MESITGRVTRLQEIIVTSDGKVPASTEIALGLRSDWDRAERVFLLSKAGSPGKASAPSSTNSTSRDRVVARVTEWHD